MKSLIWPSVSPFCPFTEAPINWLKRSGFCDPIVPVCEPVGDNVEEDEEDPDCNCEAPAPRPVLPVSAEPGVEACLAMDVPASRQLVMQQARVRSNSLRFILFLVFAFICPT